MTVDEAKTQATAIIQGVVGNDQCTAILAQLDAAGIRFEPNPDQPWCEYVPCGQAATMMDVTHVDNPPCDIYHYYCAGHAPTTAVGIA